MRSAFPENLNNHAGRLDHSKGTIGAFYRDSVSEPEAGMKYCIVGVFLFVLNLLAYQISEVIHFEALLYVGMILRQPVLRTDT